MCRYSVIHTHTQSELHFLPALANFTFFYSILLPFFSFASLTRSTMPSAMVDTIRKGKTTKRKINHISFYYSSKLAGSDLFPLSSLSHCRCRCDKFIRSHELRNDYKTLSSPHEKCILLEGSDRFSNIQEVFTLACHTHNFCVLFSLFMSTLKPCLFYITF